MRRNSKNIQMEAITWLLSWTLKECQSLKIPKTVLSYHQQTNLSSNITCPQVWFTIHFPANHHQHERNLPTVTMRMSNFKTTKIMNQDSKWTLNLTKRFSYQLSSNKMNLWMQSYKIHKLFSLTKMIKTTNRLIIFLFLKIKNIVLVLQNRWKIKTMIMVLRSFLVTRMIKMILSVILSDLSSIIYLLYSCFNQLYYSINYYWSFRSTFIGFH